MKVIKISDYGFCPAVNKCISKARELIKQKTNNEAKIYATGAITHNEEIKEELDKLGLKIGNPTNPNDTIIIQVHSIPKNRLEKLKKQKVNIVDMTCPFVLSIINNAKNINNFAILVGQKGHDEEISIESHLKNCLVIEKYEDLSKIPKNEKITLLCQSTCSEKLLEEVREYLKNTDYTDLAKTCPIVQKRIEETKNCILNADALIVVGSSTSANAKRYAQEGIRLSKPTIITLNTNEAIKEAKNYKSVALSCATSAPKKKFNEIYNALIKL